jgi:hypothetical protein
MKKVLILSVAVMLIFVITVSAQATESNWRFTVLSDDNNGGYTGEAQYGMYPTSSDGYDAQDKPATYLADPDQHQYQAWTSGVISGRSEMFWQDINAPFATDNLTPTKSWDIRVYALKDATYTNIRLRFKSSLATTALLMPATFNGVTVEYYWKMLDNRGVTGAPANLTTWIIPRMSVVDTTNPFFTLVLPTGYGSGGNDIMINPSTFANAAAEGYAMEFGIRVPGTEPPVPEPSSMLALGSGLTGLIGFVIRRRRA